MDRAAELSKQNTEQRLLLTADEIRQLAADDAHSVDNLVAARRNYLRFDANGMALARAAFAKDGGPNWWQMHKLIGQDISRAKRNRVK